MHVEATAGLSGEAIICRRIVGIVSNGGHEGLLEAEWSHGLRLSQAYCRLHRGCLVSGCRLLAHRRIVVSVLSLLLEHDHDLANLSAAQRSIII